jgi:4-hydroxybenzoate polyprenyltransferase
VLIGFGLAYITNFIAFTFIATYLFINVLYSIWMKNQPVIDCFCIATGFVLRVFAGGATYGGGVSDWLFLTIVAMSLFMAFGKRRGELVKIDGSITRTVLTRYNMVFLNGIMFACAGLTIVFYSLWAMSRDSNMIFTVPLVVFIVCKYLLLICNLSSSFINSSTSTTKKFKCFLNLDFKSELLALADISSTYSIFLYSIIEFGSCFSLELTPIITKGDAVFVLKRLSNLFLYCSLITDVTQQKNFN